MPTPLELKEPLVQKPEAERASGYSEAGHAHVALAPPSGWARLARFLAVFGVETAEEAKVVCLLALQAHLANAVFALGRNIGPVLFMQLVGPRGLTLAVFLSGLAVMLASPLYARCSSGRRAAAVSRGLVFVFVALILAFAAPLLLPSAAPPPPWLLAAAGYGVFLAEDLLTMLLMMQSASLAQASLTTYSAKRLLGLIQLGASTGAMTAGLLAGPLARAVGPAEMVFVQVALLLASLLPTHAVRKYDRESVPHAKEGGAAGGVRRAAHADESAAGDEWWRSPLILAMAMWTFGIIFCKTVVEYQYNVLVGTSLDAEEMVALTGQLYAAAGLASSLLNLFGTAPLLRHLGMLPTVLVCPLFLLVGAVAMLVFPGVLSSFCGRAVDLTLRWSLNNTVKSLLWLATPRAHQIHAKPWVEGTVKKVTASATALLIGLWLFVAHGDGAVPSLSIMSVAVAAVCCAACVAMQRRYARAMWEQIQRRELQLCDAELPLTRLLVAEDAYAADAAVPELDAHAGGGVLRRLRDGPPHVQLYILRQMGAALPAAAWASFLDGFGTLAPAVQVRALKMCATHRGRFSDARLLRVIEAYVEAGGADADGARAGEDKAAVAVLALVAAAERCLLAARPQLVRLLECRHVRVRAAAAAALLRVGWGVGLGQVSYVALSVLEEMCGVPLGEGRVQPLYLSPLRARSHGGGRGEAEALRRRVGRLAAEWEALVHSDVPQAMAVAVELTRLKARLARAEAEADEAPPGDFALPPAAAAAAAEEAEEAEEARAGSGHGEEVANATVAEPYKRAFHRAAATASLTTRLKQVIAATEMLRYLPISLLPVDSLLQLLRHPSHYVRDVALPLLRPELCTSPAIRELIQCAVECLDAAETSHHACKTLRKLAQHASGHEAEMSHAAVDCAMAHLRALLRRARVAPPPPAPPPAVAVRGVLQFLKQLGALELPHAAGAARGSLADELLLLAGECDESECSRELLDAVLHFQAHGKRCSTSLLEPQIRSHAFRLVQGLAVLQWLQQLARSEAGIAPAALRRLGNEMGLAGEGRPTRPLTIFCDLCVQYTHERLYLQRLRLVKLSMLCTDDERTLGQTLAAWKLLRSEDAKSASAALEVLESTLARRLAAIVLPLLDQSPLEKKLKGAEAHFAEARVAANCPPPWLFSWLMETADPIGTVIAHWCAWISALAHSTAAAAPLAEPPPSDPLLSRMVLLRGTRLFRGLLALHVAALAQRAAERTVARGERFSRAGESYFIISGRVRREGRQEEHEAGDTLQELGCIYSELPPLQLEATTESRLLVLQHSSLWELMVHLPPKFALSLLRALVQLAPKPSQPGAGRQPMAPGSARPGVAVSELETATSTADAKDDDIAEQSAGRTFSPVERALVLREVKLLRYVDTEYLTSLAQIATEQRVLKGDILCLQGERTSACLIIVAQGSLQLTQSFADGSSAVIRNLGVGDSLGNTGLISDSWWEYTAIATENMWTLTIARQDLTDLLRGRPELAHSVLRGVYHAFTRRLRQVVAQDGEVKREWLLAADLDKSPAASRPPPLSSPSGSLFSMTGGSAPPPTKYSLDSSVILPAAGGKTLAEAPAAVEVADQV